MTKKNIILLTKGYPFGFSEASFLDEEMSTMLEKHNIVCTIALNGGIRSDERRYKGESLVYEPSGQKQKVTLGLKLKFYVKIVLPFLLKLLPKVITYKTSLQDTKHILSQLLKYLDMAIYLEQMRLKENADFFYSYWLDHWNVAACVHKVMFNKDVKVLSRAHRFEVVKETSKLGFFPFHSIQFKYSDKIVFISDTLRKEYNLLYPSYKSKLVYHPLGVNNSNEETDNHQWSNKDEFNVVSISNIKPIKNLELLAHALKNSNLMINWYHFGASKENHTLRDILEGTKVTYHNMGFWENEKLQEFLQNSFFHFLMNTSKSEGVPVSMMEAISYGIPIIATDVGGVKEVVTDKSGILVEKDINSSKLTLIVKEALLKYSFLGESRTEVRKFAFNNFNAQNNYTRFAQIFHE